MTVDPLTVLREALDSCDSLCARAPLCADFAAARAALAAVERLVKDVRKLDRLDGRYDDLNTARYLAREALARFEGDSQQGTAA